MVSHSVTCHPTQVSAPCLMPARQTGTRFIYFGRMKDWITVWWWFTIIPKWFTCRQVLTTS